MIGKKSSTVPLMNASLWFRRGGRFTFGSNRRQIIQTWGGNTCDNYSDLRDFLEVSTTYLRRKYMSVADLGGWPGARPPLQPKIFSISCSFSQNLAKSYVGAPGELAPPPMGNPGSAPACASYSNMRESPKVEYCRIGEGIHVITTQT